MGQSTLQRPNRRTVESEKLRLQQKMFRCRRLPRGPREACAAVPIAASAVRNFVHARFRWSTRLEIELVQIGG
jgi:hypothetical protein